MAHLHPRIRTDPCLGTGPCPQNGYSSHLGRGVCLLLCAVWIFLYSTTQYNYRHRPIIGNPLVSNLNVYWSPIMWISRNTGPTDGHSIREQWELSRKSVDGGYSWMIAGNAWTGISPPASCVYVFCWSQEIIQGHCVLIRKQNSSYIFASSSTNPQKIKFVVR